MNSELAKVLHPVGGRPLLLHSISNAQTVSSTPAVIIVNQESGPIADAAKSFDKDIVIAVQEEQLGTGHALQQAEKSLRDKTDMVLVTSADLPLLSTETFQSLVDEHQKKDTPVTMLTVDSDNPRGFGRIVRDKDENVTGIVEEAQATEEQLAINELNVGAYCFTSEWLWEALAKIQVSPKGEYYLTDLIGIAVDENISVQTIALTDPHEAIGVNNRVHLAEVEAYMRKRINDDLMLSGVTLIDPLTTYIDGDVSIGKDTVIMPNTHIKEGSIIGENCTIGPNAIIRNTNIGDHCEIGPAVLEEAIVENHVDIGPFSHLRKGSHLADGVHIGNYGEVKNSYFAAGVKMGHFSYMGDATVGENVNIGAGTITANYDGKNKHRTEIDSNAFIGSDTMLVAPLKIGKDARTGAGSVVTKDVPDGTVVVGIPARAIGKTKKRE